jgi:hypothetical protein
MTVAAWFIDIMKPAEGLVTLRACADTPVRNAQRHVTPLRTFAALTSASRPYIGTFDADILLLWPNTMGLNDASRESLVSLVCANQ